MFRCTKQVFAIAQTILFVLIISALRSNACYTHVDSVGQTEPVTVPSKKILM
jgi:hypothetical protein